MARYVRQYHYAVFRQGDTFFSHSRRAIGRLVRRACAWAPTRKGRRAARKAARNRGLPNHGGSVQNDHGQKYPVEAGPRGYEQNLFEDYRGRRNFIIELWRWSGFDNPEIRKLSAQVLELWSRRGKQRRKYDWWGAITSSPLGRHVFWWKKEDPEDLFCTEGVLHLHVICGILGEPLPYNVDPGVVKSLIEKRPDDMPKTANPLDLRQWMVGRSDFTKVLGFIV